MGAREVLLRGHPQHAAQEFHGSTRKGLPRAQISNFGALSAFRGSSSEGGPDVQLFSRTGRVAPDPALNRWESALRIVGPVLSGLSDAWSATIRVCLALRLEDDAHGSLVGDRLPGYPEVCMRTTVDEIVHGIHRISTYLPDGPPGGITFNQFVVAAEEPLVFHTPSEGLSCLLYRQYRPPTRFAHCAPSRYLSFTNCAWRRGRPVQGCAARGRNGHQRRSPLLRDGKWRI